MPPAHVIKNHHHRNTKAAVSAFKAEIADGMKPTPQAAEMPIIKKNIPKS